MVKVGDFGLAMQLNHSISARSSIHGTDLYMAPEVYDERTCLKSDVWSLGISIIEMAEGKNPYAGLTPRAIMNKVVNGELPSLTSPGWSSDLVDFVSHCLVKDVEERVSSETEQASESAALKARASVNELLNVRVGSKSDA